MSLVTTLTDTWDGLETSHGAIATRLQQLIKNDLLTRVYLAIEGIPSKRVLVIEVPYLEKENLIIFDDANGLCCALEKTGYEKNNYYSCIIKNNQSVNNDIFTMLVADIMICLRKIGDENKYVETLKDRILQWKKFFTDKKSDLLNESMIIGLFGEISFIKDMQEQSYKNISLHWNGPLKAAQDFQSEKLAIEIKSSVSNKISNVGISSLEQLDIGERENLFLLAYQLEADDSCGYTLPELIDATLSNMPDANRSIFIAKLLCLGYSNEQRNAYTNAYRVVKRNIYNVNDEFPKILRRDIPNAITSVKYNLNLQECECHLVNEETLYSVLENL